MLRSTAFALLVALVLSAGNAVADPASPRPAGAAALGPPPWIGVSMDSGGDTGVRVEQVVRGSPAERAGVRVGDRIVSLDSAPVTAPGQVTRTVATHHVGETVALGLERSGTPVVVSIVLAARPSSDEILRMHLVGAPAPAWKNATPIGSAPASLAQLRGRVVIVDFWASFCGPCRLIAPRLTALKERFAAQGLSVVGITTDAPEQAAVFAERFGMRYGVVVDESGETNRAYGITGLPTMLVLDKKGTVREVFVGFDPSGDARIEAIVRQLLAEPAPGVAPVPPSSAPARGR